MKIGEFARTVGTRISVLRHYDREDLLCPVFIDKFTGYRYYDETQSKRYNQIVSLKDAGLTLNEIKAVLNGSVDAKVIFERKKSELEQTLRNLEQVSNNMSEMNFTKIEPEYIRENTDLPFENDEKVLGKWEIVSSTDIQMGGKKREIYFLPNGEQYWCYGWTKGKFLFDDGCNSSVNDYTLEEHTDGLYMIIKFKSYDYLKSGTVTPIALKQLDNKRYNKNEIARKDNINLPFRNDEKAEGKWKAVDYILSKEDFSASISSKQLYFKSVEFFADGACSVVYGDEIISGNENISWTKGYMLRKWNNTACAYEIRNVEDIDYLIIEWKSGDYRWGGEDTDYYVFIRE